MPITEKELDSLAEKVACKVKGEKTTCDLSIEERQAVRELIATKKNAVRAVFWLFGAFVLWVLKDLYIYIVGHMNFK